MNLTSNTILVTGGGAGIGVAMARQLAERGNRVIICGRSEAALLQAQAQVPDLLIRVCDITDQASRQAMVNWLSSEHPQLNILVTIINVTSALAYAPIADLPVYCATKAAMHSFTLTLRHQLKATAVRVVELAPPIVDTGLGGNERSAGTAGQRMMTPQDFATEALVQLASGQDEVLVGLAAGARKMGEGLFARMNP